MHGPADKHRELMEFLINTYLSRINQNKIAKTYEQKISHGYSTRAKLKKKEKKKAPMDI